MCARSAFSFFFWSMCKREKTDTLTDGRFSGLHWICFGENATIIESFQFKTRCWKGDGIVEIVIIKGFAQEKRETHTLTPALENAHSAFTCMLLAIAGFLTPLKHDWIKPNHPKQHVAMEISISLIRLVFIQS